MPVASASSSRRILSSPFPASSQNSSVQVRQLGRQAAIQQGSQAATQQANSCPPIHFPTYSHFRPDLGPRIRLRLAPRSIHYFPTHCTFLPSRGYSIGKASWHHRPQSGPPNTKWIPSLSLSLSLSLSVPITLICIPLSVSVSVSTSLSFSPSACLRGTGSKQRSTNVSDKE